MDISERVQKEKALELAKKEKAHRQIQQMFLANMSHELRTPMHAVMSYSFFLLGIRSFPLSLSAPHSAN